MPVTLNASTSSGFIATSDTSGNIELQANGTTKATVSSSGLAIGQYNPSASLITSGTAVASTSGTNIDFTGIPSWVKRITVMFNGVSLNSNVNLIVQVGSGSIATSGYNSTGSYLSTGPGTANSTSSFVMFTDASNFLMSGAMVLTNINSNNWVSTHMIKNNTASTSFGGGDVSLGGTLDRVRITSSSGTATFDAGTINILYE
jgi:hypothetical protein